MTTITWDGESISSDSQATKGNFQKLNIGSKISRLKNGNVVGFCGSALLLKEAFRWLDTDRSTRPASLFNDDEESHWEVIEIDRNKNITHHYSGGSIVFPNQNFAIGSGSSYALGAMAAGANGIEAIEIASKLDAGSGGDIYTMKLANFDFDAVKEPSKSWWERLFNG